MTPSGTTPKAESENCCFVQDFFSETVGDLNSLENKKYEFKGNRIEKSELDIREQIQGMSVQQKRTVSTVFIMLRVVRIWIWDLGIWVILMQHPNTQIPQILRPKLFGFGIRYFLTDFLD
jgi:hypothetical protein